MTIQGLTQAQVAERQQAGQTNHVELKTSRSYWDIIKTNVFDPVNIVLYVIGGGMFMVRDTRSAIMVVGLIYSFPIMRMRLVRVDVLQGMN